MTNVIAHGVDLVDVHRVEQMASRHGQRFLDRVFTLAEQEYCQRSKRRFEHYAGRFAAKEAVMKVLGTGWRNGIAWSDIEVVNASSGAPSVRLAGLCAVTARERGIATILISISHTDSHAIASAIGLGGREARERGASGP